MKIIRFELKKLNIHLVEPFTYATTTLEYLPYVLVIITSDEGIAGIGEVAVAWDVTGETQKSALGMKEYISPLLQDETVSELEDVKRIMHKIERNIAKNTALKSGIEMALLDVLGHYQNEPIWKLMGGKLNKKSVVLQKTLSFEEQKDPQYIKHIEDAVKQGVKTLKLKIGKNMQKELELITLIGNKLPSIRFILDVNQGWNSVNVAKNFIRSLEKLGVDVYIEQPFQGNNYKEMIRLCQFTSIPVMADESCHTLLDLENLFARKAIDCINIKIAKTGGLLEAIRMIEFCEKKDIKYMLGDMIQSSIGTAANLHLSTTGNFMSLDLTRPERLKNDVATGLHFEGYLVNIPSKPGLGITLKEKWIK